MRLRKGLIKGLEDFSEVQKVSWEPFESGGGMQEA